MAKFCLLFLLFFCSLSGNTKPTSTNTPGELSTHFETSKNPHIYFYNIKNNNSNFTNPLFVTHPSPTLPSSPPTLVLSEITDPISCNGQCDANITLTTTGGTGPYTYSWNNGPTTNTNTNLCPGEYSVTVTDFSGCSATETYIITPVTTLTLTGTTTNVNCNGVCNGNISLSANGGTPPYSFLWNNGATAQNLSFLCANNYLVTLTDSHGCSTTAGFDITQPSPLLLNGFTTPSDCGSCNGTITSSVSGGAPPYSFSWNSGLPPWPSQTDICAGTYHLTLTDNLGCTTNTSFVVNTPSGLDVMLTPSPANCYDDCSGAVSSSISGGNLPYSFQWSNGSSFQNQTDLCIGFYSLTVTDADGCSLTASTYVGSPTLLYTNIALSGAGCPGECNATLNLSVFGGVAPYTYQWADGLGTSQYLDYLCPGNYQGTVTDAHGCTQTVTASIPSPGPMSATATHTNPTCYDLCNATMQITTEGGTPPYHYNWSCTPDSDTSAITGLCPGICTVTITDSGGCSITLSENLTEPAPINAAANTFSATCQNTCDGYIHIDVSGGAPPYQYNWSNGIPNTSNPVNLCTGTYLLTISDNNGCTELVSYTIGAPTPLTTSAALSDPLCHNACNGSINLTSSGGTPPYSYSWLPAELNGIEDPTNLCAGTYWLTLTDGLGCDATFEFELYHPTELEANLDTDTESDPGSNDGSISADPSGGTPTYYYLWSNDSTSQQIDSLPPGTYTLTLTDNNGCTVIQSAVVNSSDCDLTIDLDKTHINCYGGTDGMIEVDVDGEDGNPQFAWSNGSTAEILSDLPAGYYHVTVTDQANCAAIAYATLNQPEPLNGVVNVNSVPCPLECEGVLEVEAFGGNPPYDYDWNTGSGSDEIDELCVGLYSVTIEDDNHCTLQLNKTITESSALTLSLNATDLTYTDANDGTASANVNGGTPDYIYEWNNGSGNSSLNNLAPGIYCVTITDNNDCTTTGCVTVNGIACNLSATLTTNDVSCHDDSDGSVTATPLGGIAPISYNWSMSTSNANSVSGLNPGTYSVTITDALGCEAVHQFSITNPSVLTISYAAISSVSCNGYCDAAIDLSPQGGTPPYSINWSNGSSAEDQSGLCPGEYNVWVTDSENCATSDNLIFLDPPTLVMGVTTTDETALNANDGSATANPFGGSPPYNYLWNTGANTETISPLAPGMYCVTVVDENGCNTSACGFVQGTSCTLSGNVTATQPTCHEGTDGSATIDMSNGTPPYTYYWPTSNNTTDTETGLAAGTYMVTITDVINCTLELPVYINQPAPVQSEATSLAEPSCFGFCDGTISIGSTGGSGGYTYLWNFGSNTPDQNNLCAGTYTLITTDNAGCSSPLFITLDQPPAMNLSFTIVNESISGANDGALTAFADGGVSGFTYVWDNGATGPEISNLMPGLYCVTATDQSGCTITNCATVNSGDCTLDGFLNADMPNCFGSCDGAINALISTGNGPFDYEWSTGSTAPSINGLCAGEYSITITDASGCVMPLSLVINNPAELTTDVASTPESSPGSMDGSINLTVSGDNPPYTFNWSNGATTEDIENLSGGNYCVTILDNNNCTLTDCWEVEQLGCALYLDYEVAENLCANDCNGSIDVTPVDGVGPFGFNWNNGATDEDLNGLCNGTYMVTVTDFFGCSTSQSIIVDGSNTMSNSITADGGNCGTCDGFIFVSTSGGGMPYYYDWNIDSLDGSPNITDLCPGTYLLTVTDNNGCSEEFSQTLDSASQINLSVAILDACYGQCDADVGISALGGIPPYQFDTDLPPVDICPGIYNVTVTDAAGCFHIDSFVVAESPEITYDLVGITHETNSLSNGSIEIEVNGGTAPFSFEWHLGANLVSNEEDPSGLSAGNYSLLITDALGCQLSITDIVVDNISGLSQHDVDGSFYLYPNPANELVYILLDNPTLEISSLTLFDAQGRRIGNELFSRMDSQMWSFDVSLLPKGVYFVQLVDAEGQVASAKLVRI